MSIHRRTAPIAPEPDQRPVVSPLAAAQAIRDRGVAAPEPSGGVQPSNQDGYRERRDAAALAIMAGIAGTGLFNDAERDVLHAGARVALDAAEALLARLDRRDTEETATDRILREVNEELSKGTTDQALLREAMRRLRQMTEAVQCGCPYGQEGGCLKCQTARWLKQVPAKIGQ